MKLHLSQLKKLKIRAHNVVRDKDGAAIGLRHPSFAGVLRLRFLTEEAIEYLRDNFLLNTVSMITRAVVVLEVTRLASNQKSRVRFPPAAPPPPPLIGRF